MSFYNLVMIEASETIVGIPPPYTALGGAATVFEAFQGNDGSGISWAIPDPNNIPVGAPVLQSIFWKCHPTSLLIKLGESNYLASIADSEPIPSGFIATSAKIQFRNIADSFGVISLELIGSWFSNGSFFSSAGSSGTFEDGYFSSELSLNLPIFLSSYGLKIEQTYTPGVSPFYYGSINYITITGEYILWSSSLTINPASEIVPNVTEITISDGEGLLNTVDDIVAEYLDPNDPSGDTIISETIPAVDFISQDANEIVFILPEDLPDDIPDCTYVTIYLIDNLGNRVFVKTIKTECDEPDIEVPGEPGEPEDELETGLGFGGIRLRGSVFGDDSPWSFGDLIDFGDAFRGIGFGGSAFENDMAIIFPEIDGGLDFGGTVGDSLSLMGNVSGIYTLIPGQTHDVLYDRQVEQTSINVKIPDPFIKTGYVKK